MKSATLPPVAIAAMMMPSEANSPNRVAKSTLISQKLASSKILG